MQANTNLFHHMLERFLGLSHFDTSDSTYMHKRHTIWKKSKVHVIYIGNLDRHFLFYHKTNKKPRFLIFSLLMQRANHALQILDSFAA